MNMDYYNMGYNLGYKTGFYDGNKEGIKEFEEKLIKTIFMLNAQELSGSGKEYDDIYFHTQHLGWVTGSTTARTEIIKLIGNTAKEMVDET